MRVGTGRFDWMEMRLMGRYGEEAHRWEDEELDPD